ncbi:hypothetical protein ACFLVV_00810 [Chloroflexota bacterium]
MPDGMGHNGTALRARDYETAALPLNHAGQISLADNRALEQRFMFGCAT